RRHHALGVRVLDPVADQAFDRGALDPVDPVLAERVVEVRPHRARGVGVRQRVARAALRGEQHLAGDQVAGGVLECATTKANHDQGSGHQRGNASQRLDHTSTGRTLSKLSAGRLGGRVSVACYTMAFVRTRQKYRMRTPSTGREVVIEAEPGKTYLDRDTGEPLEVVAELLPLAPTSSELPWAVENLPCCTWCDHLC